MNNTTSAPAHEEQIRFLQKNRHFLGREFLTWLWYQLDQTNNIVESKSLGRGKLYFDDRLVLKGESGNTHEQAFKGGSPAYSLDAKKTLLEGKTVDKVKFLFLQEDKETRFILRGEDLSVQAIQLPALEQSTEENPISLRMRQLQCVVELIETLYQEFLNFRFSKSVTSEIEEFQAWAISSSIQ